MKFYNEKSSCTSKQIHQVLDSKQVFCRQDTMWFPKDKAPENSVVCPTAFTSKGLTSAETHYGNIEREALGTLHGLDYSTNIASPMRLA